MCFDPEKNIFLIDVCQDNQRLMQLILETQGYKVTSISHKELEIEALTQNCPDLIILELMSEMSGLEIIQSFKADNHHLSEIPILLLGTQKNLQLEEIMAVDEVCYKPFEMEQLLTQIKSLLFCQENIRTSTLILDLDDRDPLVKENQKLQSMLNQGLSPWDILQLQGYEVGIS